MHATITKRRHRNEDPGEAPAGTSSKAAPPQATPTGTPEPPAVAEPAADAAHPATPAASDVPDVPATQDGRWTIAITSVLCMIFAGGGYLALWWDWRHADKRMTAAGKVIIESPIPWEIVIGTSLSLVAVTAFGGYFLASLRARVAITSSFILTFLLLLTYILTLGHMADLSTSDLVSQDFLNDFRGIIQTLIGFYFGTETAIAMTKILRVDKSLGPQAIMRADRDLPSGAGKPAKKTAA